MGVISFFRNSVLTLLDFLYPPACISCRSPHLNGQRHVCPSCWQQIDRIHAEHRLYTETKAKLLESGVVGEVVSLFVFEKEGVFQHIAHALKYQGCESLGLELGRQLGQAILDTGLEADAVIPVPLHKRKLRERGYNQAELLALGVSSATSIPTESKAVRRKKYTQTQTKLTIEEREKNMEDAFEVVGAVDGRRLILVDDVITTGATITSCARELKSAGASGIIAASAALAE
ncbi:MAG TPA: ComF family protein [Bacteroidota bacterium]|nr:ComF family protein [Bacteroidota bacterium]